MMNPNRKPGILHGFCLLLLCLFVSAAPALAQNNKGTIIGTVKDPSGAVVTGATITVTNIGTGEAREATTSDDGTYTVPSLDPGQYRVEITASGFQTSVRENVTLETNARLPLDADLTVGGSSETVTVTGDSAPLVESETSVRGDLITGREVTDLPIGQRNFTLLAALSPGVTRPVTSTIGGGGQFTAGSPVGESTESTRFRDSGGSILSVNGARVTNNNFTLDGVDNNETQFGQIGIYPNPDAIAEFKIETSLPSAESGRAGVAIVSTTFKSGTNEVHGTLYEFYQGRFGSARPTNNRNPPNFVTHNFGGTVGGPIFLPRFGEGGPALYDGRNRSFFFFSYNGQRNGTPIFGGSEFPFVNVPTARFRNGDFSELLEPNNIVTFRTVRGDVRAPRGTIFDRNGNPFAGNIIPTAQLSPAGLAFLNAYPLPTEPGRENNFRRNRSERANLNGYDIKLDHSISQSNTLFGRYSQSKSLRVRENNFPLGSTAGVVDLASGFGAGDEFGDTRQIALGDTQVFSPNVINDARAGYTRVEIGIFNPGIGGASGFSADAGNQLGIGRSNVCGLICSGTPLIGVVGNGSQADLEFVGDGGPFYFTSNNFYFGDTLTVVRGSQTYKFGGDLRVRQNVNLDAGRSGNAKGNTVYTSGVENRNGFFSARDGLPVGPQDAGNATANLLLGYSPTEISRGIPAGVPFLSSKEISFFVQDDWKVNSNLTLNLGLRYDIFTPETERFDAQANFDPATGNLVRTTDGSPNGRGGVQTDYNNFGPRIGFAYSGFKENKTLVLRGGYGLLYAKDVSGQQPLSANFLVGGRYDRQNLLPNVNLDTGPPLPFGSTPTADVFPASSNRDIFYINPNSKTEIFHQYNLTGQYEFARNFLAEIGYVGSLGRNLLVVRNIGTNGAGSREVTNFPSVLTVDSLGESRYDALQTKLERRFSRGLSILSTYTWSHAIDNTPGGFCINGPGGGSCGPSNPVLGLDFDRGNSDLDVRHRFTFANVLDIPIGRGRRFGGDLPAALDFLIGGFQLNNVIQIQSGPVYSVFSGGRRVNIVGDPFASAGDGVNSPALNRNAFEESQLLIFPNIPGSQQYGTSGRNIFRGERQEYWDSSLFKNFPVRFISEDFNVQFRVQANNLLNHVNRFRPRNDRNDSQFGIDTSIQRPRQLEFSIKLLF